MAGLFAAVNESTWEHMKLLAVPWVLFSLVEYIALRTDGVAAPRAAGLLAGLAAIPTLFYTYKGIVGQGYMIVDILIFQVSVLLAFWVSRVLQKGRRLAGGAWTVAGLLVLLGIWAVAVFHALCRKMRRLIFSDYGPKKWLYPYAEILLQRYAV